MSYYPFSFSACFAKALKQCLTPLRFVHRSKNRELSELVERKLADIKVFPSSFDRIDFLVVLLLSSNLVVVRQTNMFSSLELGDFCY